MGSVKVFGSPTSAEVARVLTCLFEKEVEFQLIRVDNYKGLERKPDYLKLQPSGQSLTFEDGRVTLVESRAICRHISEKYADQGNKELLGTGTLERASIEQWLQTEKHSFDPPASSLVFNLAFAPLLINTQQQNQKQKKQQNEDMMTTMMMNNYNANSRSEDEQRRRGAELAMVLDVYEQRLEETRYLAGDNFTLADLSHLPNAHRLMRFPSYSKLFSTRKRVSRWWEDISSRSSWKRVVEMQQEPPPEI